MHVIWTEAIVARVKAREKAKIPNTVHQDAQKTGSVMESAITHVKVMPVTMTPEIVTISVVKVTVTERSTALVPLDVHSAGSAMESAMTHA